MQHSENMEITRDYIKIWIEIAISDIKASSLLFEHKQFSASFYHFQQASEKGLKAYAFLAKIYTSEKDAYKTSHHTLQVFSSAIKKQQNDIRTLKNSPMHAIIGNGMLESHTNTLESTLDFLPAKDEIFEYSLKMLNTILDTIQGLKTFNLIFPENFEYTVRQKMIFLIQSIKSIDLERGKDMEALYNEGVINDQYLEDIKTYFQLAMAENYLVSVLFYTSLISHNHNNNTRYPDLNFNPLKYYNLKKSILKKLPEFNQHLLDVLMQLKSLNDKFA